MKKSFSLFFVYVMLLFLIIPFKSVAETLSDTSSYETLWTNGKIFVVIIVAAIIFSGIGIFLIALERKISRLEKKISDKKL